MNRVDYLITRIGQLRHRGASHIWAQFLARLELGERPAGQVYTAPAGAGDTIVSHVHCELLARAADVADRSR